MCRRRRKEQREFAPAPATLLALAKGFTMKRFLTLITAFALLFVAMPLPPALAQGDPTAQIDAYLTNLAKTENFGGQVLVAKDGKVLFQKAYGLANREHDVATTMDTRYPITDITMGVTAAAILMLQDQGKLNINDPVCKYLDNCPKKWAPITIKQLLNSTAGIINYLFQPKMKTEPDLRHTPNQLIDIFKNLPLPSEVGSTRPSYPTSSYVLLAKVIEKVSGVTYTQFVKDNIFDKLGMTNTGVDDTTRILKNRAEGYSSANTKGQYVDASNYYGFGSLYSTAGDLFKFQQAVMGGKLISPALTKEMLTPSTDVFSEGENMLFRFGYAWLTGEEEGGLRYALLQNWESWALGSFVVRGYGGCVEHFPDQDAVLVLLSNSGHGCPSLLQPALPWLKTIK